MSARVRESALLAAMSDGRHHWSLRDLWALYRRLGAPKRSTVRRDVKRLTRAGLLAVCEHDRRRYYRLSVKEDAP